MGSFVRALCREFTVQGNNYLILGVLGCLFEVLVFVERGRCIVPRWLILCGILALSLYLIQTAAEFFRYLDTGTSFGVRLTAMLLHFTGFWGLLFFQLASEFSFWQVTPLLLSCCLFFAIGEAWCRGKHFQAFWILPGLFFLGADALSYLFVDQMDFVNSVAWIFTGISGAELLLLYTVFRRKTAQYRMPQAKQDF